MRRSQYTSFTAQLGTISPVSVETPAAVLAKTNLLKIRLKFGALVSKTSDKLQEMYPDISKVQRTIITAFSIADESLRVALKEAIDFASLFDLLTTHGLLSYKNYHFLVVIISEFISDLHDDMVDYQKDYAGYQFTTNLEHHLAAETALGDPENLNSTLFSSLKIKVHIQWSERTLTYIEELWESLLIRFKLPSYHLLLQSILEGCIEIAWCFPLFETVRIIEVVKSSSQFFSNHVIAQVSINDQVLFEDTTSLQQEVIHTTYYFFNTGLRMRRLPCGRYLLALHSKPFYSLTCSWKCSH